MKALITGGSGFSGRHLVAELLRRDREVRCLARPTTARGKLAGFPIAWAEGDFDDPISLAAAVAGMDWVFHLAAAITAADRPAYERANVRATAALLQACANAHPRIRSELGFRPRFRFDEETLRRLFEGSPGPTGRD